MSCGLQATHSCAAPSAIADRKVTEQGEACRLRHLGNSLGAAWGNWYMSTTYNIHLHDHRYLQLICRSSPVFYTSSVAAFAGSWNAEQDEQ